MYVVYCLHLNTKEIIKTLAWMDLMLDCDNVGALSIDVRRDRFIESNTAVTFS